MTHTLGAHRHAFYGARALDRQASLRTFGQPIPAGPDGTEEQEPEEPADRRRAQRRRELTVDAGLPEDRCPPVLQPVPPGKVAHGFDPNG